MEKHHNYPQHHLQRKAIRKSTPKKKPIKVVYISNPMKVNTSASEFRSLVQQLTGQDSDSSSSPDPTKLPNDAGLGHDHPTAEIDSSKSVADEVPAADLPSQQQQLEQNNERDRGLEYEPFDYGYDYDHIGYSMPHQNSLMMDNFSGFLPSSLCCESSASSLVDDF